MSARPPVMDVVGFQKPPNIHDQAAKYLLLTNEKRFQCEEIPVGNHSLPFNIIFCAFDEYLSTEAATIPLYLLIGIGTKKVSNSQSTPKYMGIRHGTGIYESTNAILGEVNRPRLCLIPSLILLAILVALSIVSRIWLKGGNVTLQLWKWFCATLDAANSENPIFVSREKQNGSVNLLDAAKCDLRTYASRCDASKTEHMHDV